jgi:hypothetical protein
MVCLFAPAPFPSVKPIKWVGTWDCQYSSVSMALIIRPNGTYMEYLTEYGEPEERPPDACDGRWKTNKSILILESNSGDIFHNDIRSGKWWRINSHKYPLKMKKRP